MASKFFDTDLDYSCEEELSAIRSLTNEDLAESLNDKITVCYALADIDSTQYGFGQAFDQKDTLMYFSTMKKFSANSLNSLFENRHVYHLYRSSVKGNLLSVLKSVYPELTEGNTPEIYHFALYTQSDTNASRDSGVRSPRIYFVLADYGRIYPIFFDPYHELNPIY